MLTLVRAVARAMEVPQPRITETTTIQTEERLCSTSERKVCAAIADVKYALEKSPI